MIHLFIIPRPLRFREKELKDEEEKKTTIGIDNDDEKGDISATAVKAGDKPIPGADGKMCAGSIL